MQYDPRRTDAGRNLHFLSISGDHSTVEVGSVIAISLKKHHLSFRVSIARCSHRMNSQRPLGSSFAWRLTAYAGVG
jgi:hypothetical protein